MQQIDRDSPIPVYYQIAVDMRRRIQMREWPTDQRLPSEPDLASMYRVTRVTMRQALSELVKDGLLKRQRGSGTFVNEQPKPLTYDLGLPVSFSKRILEMGYKPEAQVLDAQVFSDPFPDIAKQLRLHSNEPAAYLKRVLTADRIPVAIDRSWFSNELCPGIATTPLIQNSISQTLSSRYNLVPVRSETTFESTRASIRDARILDSYPETPLILLTTATFLKDGTPVEYSTTSWLGERVRFHMEFNSH
jgi:DNA-binding GntR family transcriptional regulator